MKLLGEVLRKPSARKVLNSELWHACAGPLVSLPQPGSLVYYFPQGHSEQVTASTRKIANSQIPAYTGLQSQLMCQVHNVTLHENDVFPIPDLGHTRCNHPTEFFCKILIDYSMQPPNQNLLSGICTITCGHFDTSIVDSQRDIF
ncbi:unnamed protein product [Musa acuminata subsp. burmannicoides]